MKGVFISIVIVSIFMVIVGSGLTSCTPPPPKYRYCVQNVLPDSNKIKMATWIKESMSSSSFHLTTSDYEDPEDVIEQLEETGTKLFSVKVEGLEILMKESGYEHYVFVPKNELTGEQLKEMERLKK